MTPAQILALDPAALSPEQRQRTAATLARAVAAGEVALDAAERWLERLRALES